MGGGRKKRKGVWIGFMFSTCKAPRAQGAPWIKYSVLPAASKLQLSVRKHPSCNPFAGEECQMCLNPLELPASALSMVWICRPLEAQLSTRVTRESWRALGDSEGFAVNAVFCLVAWEHLLKWVNLSSSRKSWTSSTQSYLVLLLQSAHFTKKTPNKNDILLLSFPASQNVFHE